MTVWSHGQFPLNATCLLMSVQKPCDIVDGKIKRFEELLKVVVWIENLTMVFFWSRSSQTMEGSIL